VKSIERHKLKEDEFARTVRVSKERFEQHREDFGRLAVAALVVVALAGAYVWWNSARNEKAGGMLAAGLAVYEAPVVPVPPPAPGSPAPVQQPGTYPTENAKLEAALPKLQAAADAYPSSDAGIAARYYAATALAALGRHAEAEQRYQEVATKAGNGLYGRMARLGVATEQVAQKKFDSAIAIYKELTTDTASNIPVDGVLMQLGRACEQAGKKEEAQRAFNRIVTEFQDSGYAADAKRALEESRKS
jgi:TolA-binding protein